MSDATHPWWASAPDPDRDDDSGPRAIDDADPVEAFRAARRPRPVPPRAAAPGAASRGQGPRRPGAVPDPDPGHGPGPEAGRASGSGSDDQAGQPSPHRPELCGICPLCTLARTLEDTRPELLDHLTEAARHLAAAARSLLDTGAAEAGPTASSRPAADHGAARRPRGEVERIPLDPRGRADTDRGGGT
ncbi:MAG: hypothetical protein R6V28_04260 [Nitriliruptoraceae bacterium]